jgi:hypothetical protein
MAKQTSKSIHHFRSPGIVSAKKEYSNVSPLDQFDSRRGTLPFHDRDSERRNGVKSMQISSEFTVSRLSCYPLRRCREIDSPVEVALAFHPKLNKPSQPIHRNRGWTSISWYSTQERNTLKVKSTGHSMPGSLSENPSRKTRIPEAERIIERTKSTNDCPVASGNTYSYGGRRHHISFTLGRYLR